MKNFNETQAVKTILRTWYFSFAETGQSAYCRSARFPSEYTGILPKTVSDHQARPNAGAYFKHYGGKYGL